MSKVEQFELHLFASDAVDPEGIHHEFGQGLHGQKVNFDNIGEDDQLFEEWLDLTAEFMLEEYDKQPDALVGVANGTNRVAQPLADRLGGVIFLETEKRERSNPVLTSQARLLVQKFKPVFALVIEDVGTVGTNSLSAAQSTLEAGVPRVEVLNTLQRSPTLPLLDEAGVAHRSIIKRVLPNYTEKACREEGLCAAGWELIPYGAG